MIPARGRPGQTVDAWSRGVRNRGRPASWLQIGGGDAEVCLLAAVSPNRRGSMKPAIALAAVAALAVPLIGCGEEDDLGFRLSLRTAGYEEVLNPLLTVTATSGDWEVTATGAELTAAEDGSGHAWTVDTPRAGMIGIHVVLREPGGTLLAETDVGLAIRSDWEWDVTVQLADRNPTEMCFGCIGHVAVPVPADLIPDVPDSLYVVWGGNWIHNPVVY